MTQRKFPCKNHPEQLSAKKCYHCKNYICSDCQQKYFHHLFCGYWCAGKYFLVEKFLNKRQYREYAILLLIIFIMQVLLLLILLPNQDAAINHADNAQPLSLDEQRAMSPAESAMTLDTIYSTLSQSLSLSGNGPPNTLLGLWQNGVFSAATVSNGGHYRFPRQVLSLGTNTFLVWALSEQGMTTLVDSFSVIYSSRRIEYLSMPFSSLLTSKKILSLTFDGGSLASGADSILSILDEKKVHATFFLTGNFIQKFPAIVKRLVDSDHELGNHTYSHSHLTSFESDGKQDTRPSLSRQVLFRQLNKTDSLLYDSFKVHFKPYWRAPFGEYNHEILLWAAEAGYKHIGWSQGGDTRDWVIDEDSPLYRSAEEIYDYLLDLESRGRLKGAVILMHLHSDREDTKPYEILADLIDELQNRGYQLMTISDLIYAASSI